MNGTTQEGISTNPASGIPCFVVKFVENQFPRPGNH